MPTATPDQLDMMIRLLTQQHQWYSKEFDGKIIYAPLDLTGRTLKVLDVGCADGALLRSLRTQIGVDSELAGLDNNAAFFPQEKDTTGITFVKHDMREPLPGNLKGRFDIVHVRYSIYGAGKDLEATVKHLTEALVPGDWLQVHEPDMTTGQNGKNAALAEYIVLYNGLVAKMGGDPDCCSKLEGAFKAAGLQDVTVEKHDTKVGKGAKYEDESIEVFSSWVPSITEYAKQYDVANLEDKESLGERLKTELGEVGGSFQRYVALGRKA